MTGTARAQEQVRQSLVFTNSPALLQPEMLVSYADAKFDAAGRLTDATTRQFLVEFLRAFEAWIPRFVPVRANPAPVALAAAAD
jgi:chromate reductase